jgi:hypothetical protein
MGLKGDMVGVLYENKYVASTNDMEKGGIACVSTAGSGNKTTISYPGNPSGAYAVGVLMETVDKDLDWTDRPRYTEKGTLDAGEQVPLLVIGQVNTNMIVTGVTPSPGETAYLGASGKVTNVLADGAPTIGQFATMKDANGYVYLDVRL